MPRLVSPLQSAAILLQPPGAYGRLRARWQHAMAGNFKVVDIFLGELALPQLPVLGEAPEEA